MLSVSHVKRQIAVRASGHSPTPLSAINCGRVRKWARRGNRAMAHGLNITDVLLASSTVLAALKLAAQNGPRSTVLFAHESTSRFEGRSLARELARGPNHGGAHG